MCSVEKIDVTCNQTGEHFNVYIDSLFNDAGENLTSNDLKPGSQALMEYKKKSYPVTVVDKFDGKCGLHSVMNLYHFLLCRCGKATKKKDVNEEHSDDSSIESNMLKQANESVSIILVIHTVSRTVKWP